MVTVPGHLTVPIAADAVGRTASLVCTAPTTAARTLDLAWFLAVVAKVRLSAFAWGVGTAIGELPPFFAARAGASVPRSRPGQTLNLLTDVSPPPALPVGGWPARLAGEQDEGHMDVMSLAERADKEGLGALTWPERATVVSYRAMKHLGFFGIMLLASVR